jgi:hypothetical protein
MMLVSERYQGRSWYTLPGFIWTSGIVVAVVFPVLLGLGEKENDDAEPGTGDLAVVDGIVRDYSRVAGTARIPPITLV